VIAPSTAFVLAERRSAGVHSTARVAVLVGRLMTVRPRTVALIAFVAAALSVEAVVAAPYIERSADALSAARPGWIAVALAVELSSMISFARLQRVMLRSAGVRVRLRDALVTVFAGNAMTLTLPGGSVASFAYTLRRMRSWGASAPLAAFSLTATGVLSAVALAVLAAVGGAFSGDVSALGLTLAEIAGIAALVAAALTVLSRPAIVRRIALAAVRLWHRVRPSSTAGQNLDGLLAELATLHPSARTWARGLAFAGANWATDVLCLFAAGRAVGATPSVATLLLAYAAGMAAASSIPLLPGGLGAVEAAIVVTFVHGGVPAAPATAAVLIYRLISYGLSAVAGWTLLGVSTRRRSARQAAAPLSAAPEPQRRIEPWAATACTSSGRTVRRASSSASTAPTRPCGRPPTPPDSRGARARTSSRST
jgi:putative heme transporter